MPQDREQVKKGAEMTASRSELKREIAELRRQRRALSAQVDLWRFAARVGFVLATLLCVVVAGAPLIF